MDRPLEVSCHVNGTAEQLSLKEVLKASKHEAPLKIRFPTNIGKTPRRPLGR